MRDVRCGGYTNRRGAVAWLDFVLSGWRRASHVSPSEPADISRLRSTCNGPCIGSLYGSPVVPAGQYGGAAAGKPTGSSALC